MKCSSMCEECLNGEVCTKCPQGRYLTNGFCNEKCSYSEYPDEQKICHACSDNCLTCSAPTTCTSCPAGLNLFNSTCIAKCPNGTFSDNKICLPCDTPTSNSAFAPCLTCSSYKLCSSCPTPYLLSDSRCVQTCSIGSYPTANKCLKCPKPCQICTD